MTCCVLRKRISSKSAFVLGAMIDSARVVVLDGPIDISRSWYFFLRNFVARRFQFLRLTEITRPSYPGTTWLEHFGLPCLAFVVWNRDRLARAEDSNSSCHSRHPQSMDNW